MKKIIPSALSVATLAVLSTACVKVESLDPIKAVSKTFETKKKKKSNRITNAKDTNLAIKMGSHDMQIMSESMFKSQEGLKKNMISIKSDKAKRMLSELPSTSEVADGTPDSMVKSEESLLLGFPVSLLGEQNVFGGVITKVSDKTNENLGMLKLTDLSPIHVRTMIGYFQDGSPALSMIGCGNGCSERSQQVNLISIPIVGLDEEKGLLILDLAALGQGLDLVSMLDPSGDFTKLVAIDSATTEFDYDISTLTFDIKTKMVPKGTTVETLPTAPITEFTVRWYMKLSSSFNPAFESRKPTPEAGFFTTDRSRDEKITRFSITENGQKIKYFIKNVPQEFQVHFKSALDNWNEKFKETVGVEPITYEFVNKDNERYSELIPGDIRYNIIEWDENNIAPYGGLGPSIANQFTGETISANVLIQGPTIVDLYTKWFNISKDIRELRAAGQIDKANEMIQSFNTSAKELVASRQAKKFTMKLGKKLEMKINAQRPELEDPIIKGHFEVVPEGVSYEEYMKGYLGEMVAHEIGHNLGLRHNFKGNLGSDDSHSHGSVSRSIMEYLGREYRHLNAIGEYDTMAISYGYSGVAPGHADWFCTDEDQASGKEDIALKSPECSKSDATNDPFSFWEGRLKRALDLAVNTKDASAPVWNVFDLEAQIKDFSTAFANYASAAENTGDTWTNFFNKPGRPENKYQVRGFVIESMKKILCNPELEAIVNAKETEEGKTLAKTNLESLRLMVGLTTSELKSISLNDLNCN